MFYRFGSGVRTQKKDPKVPGAGTYHPNLIEVQKKEAKKGPNTQRFKPLPNEKTAFNWPSAAAYKLPVDKPRAACSLGPKFDEKRVPMYKKADGSRFDSMIRAKPHLRPKKVDGPGPGDYKLPDSVKVHRRNANST